MFLNTPSWWWKTDSYDKDELLPKGFKELAGPKGVGVVKAWPNGSTSTGWGEATFARKYRLRHFHPNIVRKHYGENGDPIAYLMRSMQIICIDIDGKNGGLEHASELLGNAPPTLAEVSKGGNGYHLFYKVPDSWDEAKGYAMYGDAIGIVQGVDIRAVGCVYHYPHQRWNDREIAELPSWIADRLQRRESFRQQRIENIKNIETLDEVEKLMLHEDLLEDLARDIPEGRRNTTLFSIGSQMQDALVPQWEDKVEERALEIGLSSEEASRLVNNIIKYGERS